MEELEVAVAVLQKKARMDHTTMEVTGETDCLLALEAFPSNWEAEVEVERPTREAKGREE